MNLDSIKNGLAKLFGGNKKDIGDQQPPACPFDAAGLALKKITKSKPVNQSLESNNATEAGRMALADRLHYVQFSLGNDGRPHKVQRTADRNQLDMLIFSNATSFEDENKNISQFGLVQIDEENYVVMKSTKSGISESEYLISKSIGKEKTLAESLHYADMNMVMVFAISGAEQTFIRSTEPPPASVVVEKLTM